ncbi:MAG: acetyl-CoA C-acyltransferase, partial [Rhodospirillaceae bacterium]|nr:acetyl-CoA C-acyltransferase [Rhodospirillaceae bacterium]
MREAVIVSTARTPIGKAYRGAFNDTQAQALGGHAIRHAVARAGVAPGEIDDVIMGASVQQGSTGRNMARQCALRAGLPTAIAGMSVDRQCGSGLMAIAIAAKQIVVDRMNIVVGGGLESISLTQNEHRNTHRAEDPWLVEHRPDIYMTMIETAEVVADRYGISREAQDKFALQSQARTAEAQRQGKFDEEIVPFMAQRLVQDKASAETHHVEVTLDRDEGNRPDTSLEGLSRLEPVFKGGQRIAAGRHVTAGNASQLSDGASACVLME